MAFIELGKRQHCDLITSSVASKKARTQPPSQGVPIYVYVKSLRSQQNLGHWNQKDQGLSPTSASSGSVTLGKLSTPLSLSFPIWKMGVYSTSLDWLPTVYQILLCWLLCDKMENPTDTGHSWSSGEADSHHADDDNV